jgi:DegV family protein with EDD domain
MKIKITADSTADLSQELCNKFNVTLIPLTITLGDNIYEDGVNMTPDMIYDYVSKTKQLPKTSAVNAEKYREEFEKIFAQGYDAIIHINISSEMSTSYGNAKMATKDMKNVFVVDSRNLSTGIGVQVLYAAELAKQGTLSAEEIVKKVEARINSVQAGFILDKLEYLYRGGRCNAVSLLGANLLKIKPCIEVHNGKMGMYGKCMGKFSGCVLKYVKETLKKYNTPDTTRIFVTHTKIDPQIVSDVVDYLKQNTEFKEILETTAGSTITSHCGSNTIGILFYNDGDKKQVE